MICEICGCSEHDACYDDIEDAACSWYVPGLCTFCVLGWIFPTYRQPPYPPIGELV